MSTHRDRNMQFVAIDQSAAGTATLIAAPGAGKRLVVWGIAATLAAAGTIKFQSDTLVNEVNTLTIDATGGTYELTVNGQTDAAVPFDADAAALQAAIVALSNVAPDDIVVTGGPGDEGGTTPYTLTWGAALADTDMTITTDATNLTGGAGTAVVGTTTAGGGAQTAHTGAMQLAAGTPLPPRLGSDDPYFVCDTNAQLQVVSTGGAAKGCLQFTTEDV